jgi:3-hydroxyisobutyryl-CoA hydrolase
MWVTVENNFHVYHPSNCQGCLNCMVDAGEYLGLTGTRLNGAEMLSCGLATHFVPSQRLADLEERLGSLNTSDVEIVGTAIDEFCDVVYPGEKSPLHWREAIDRCFQKENMEEIMHAVVS